MEQTNSIKVSKYIYIPETESTNLYAQKLVSKSNPDEHFCIYTDNQTRGRGQIGRFWYSDEAKNLTVSFLTQLEYKASMQFDLNMICALSVIFLVKELLPEKRITLKWPNDIYVGHEKLGGILIQNIIRGTKITHSIFGIGMNINQEEFPPGLPNPVSLSQITGKKHDILQLMFLLKQSFEDKLNYYLTRQEELRPRYISQLYMQGQKQKFLDQEGVSFDAILEGVSEEGRLLLNVEGKIRAYNFREISFIISG